MRIKKLILAGVAAALFGGSAFAPNAAGLARADVDDDATTATVLLANVGNVNPSCASEVFKLCHQATEDRIATRVQSHAPDLAVLIEVLPSRICDDVPGASVNPFGVCASSVGDERTQVERLLGPGYSVSCGRHGWDCLAVRDASGTLEVPLASLDIPVGCDDGFVVAYADVTVHDERFRVLLGHPDSMDSSCRTAALKALFAQTEDRTLLIGDMNLDPRRSSDASAELWNSMVGHDKTFAYHSDLDVPTHAASDPSALDATGMLTPNNHNCTAPFGCTTLDHVASTFASGDCDVLGETPGTERLDGGGGMDHRALVCDLSLRGGRSPRPCQPAPRGLTSGAPPGPRCEGGAPHPRRG